MTTSLPELGTLGSRVLFSVSGHYYTVADVVLAAAERGAWEAAWQMAGVGSEGTVDDGDLESAELSFRRARRLAAGDELRAWLAGLGADRVRMARVPSPGVASRATLLPGRPRR
jgi:hypothetical protein